MVPVTDATAIPLRARDGSIRAYAYVDAGHPAAALAWYLTSEGYAARTDRSAPTRVQYLHRLVLGLDTGDPRHCDHRDGDRLNCRRSNLRATDIRTNPQNQPANRGSSSRYRGVGWHKATGTWKARCTIAGREHHLGYFHDEEAAARAVSAFRSEHLPFANEARSGLGGAA